MAALARPVREATADHLRELGIDEDYGKCLMEGCDKHGDKGGGYCYTHARQFNVLAPSQQKESV